jgi:hypothetical protein
MKTNRIFLCFMVFSLVFAAMNGSLFAQEEESNDSPLGGVSLTLDFSASLVSVDNDGVFDSLTDVGFGDDNESTLSIGYDGEFFGAAASFGFAPETLRIVNGEIADMFGSNPFSIDELYAWVKPFGSYVTLTGGIFENTDGIADYTDDIDNAGIGVFILGEGGEPFTEPTEYTNAALVNGLLLGGTLGPVTAQFLLAPNYSKESATGLADEVFGEFGLPPVEAGAPFFRYGGRIIADLGFGTVSALFKTFQWPVEIVNMAGMMETGSPGTYGGSTVNYMTFGAYADITAVENLGISLGYTGFITVNDDSDVDNVLYNGIDLRATWTGIEGLSISTHNNVSFAGGVENDWSGLLGKGDSFLTLYNAIGATKELTEKFSVNAEVGNVLSKTSRGSSIIQDNIEIDSFWGGAKFITHITENAEFNAGIRFDVTKEKDVDPVLVFSVPVGIVVSF